MTHPVYHEETSRAVAGVASGLPVHLWLDATKELLADCRHRALRHNLESLPAAVEIGVSSGLSARDALSVALVHLLEDCAGRVPTVAEWGAEIRLRPWMVARTGDDEILAECTRRHGGAPADYAAILAFLRPAGASGDDRIGFLRLHAHGIFMAEKLFGVTLENSDGVTVPVRYAAETLVKRAVGLEGRIPSAADWLREMRTRVWMNRPFRPTTEGVAAASEDAVLRLPKLAELLRENSP